MPDSYAGINSNRPYAEEHADIILSTVEDSGVDSFYFNREELKNLLTNVLLYGMTL